LSDSWRRDLLYNAPMRHRLLCCSDTHGQLPPSLDESESLAWLHAGDICNAPEVLDPNLDPFEDYLLAPIAAWFKSRQERLYLVRGNHDVFDPFRAFKNCNDVTGKLEKLADHLFVAGIGWRGEKYIDLPMERDLSPVCESILRQARRLIFSQDRVILLTHYPPRLVGTQVVENDRDGGGVWYDCVRALVEQLQPLAVVQGHNHRWFGATHRIRLASRQSLILNPGTAGCVLQIDLKKDSAEIVGP
jgi:Icc-related predicted phosphoesterase